MTCGDVWKTICSAFHNFVVLHCHKYFKLINNLIYKYKEIFKNNWMTSEKLSDSHTRINVKVLFNKINLF
jgi:hypothetical protein